MSVADILHLFVCKYYPLQCNKNSLQGLVPYSGYNLRGAISANHQISYLEVIFASIKFVNLSMVLRGQINLRACHLLTFDYKHQL